MAETAKSRITILGIMVTIFFLPVVWRHKSASLVSLICWIIFGISCYLYIKLQRVGI
jgi:hypothetical protein